MRNRTTLKRKRPVRNGAQAILLDAGGVLVWPNWTRIAEALARQGISADPASLAAADPHARYALDVAEIVNTSTDLRRALEYFNLVLTHAGVPLSDRTDRALAEVREYQRVTNLWEHVPEFVCPTLKALRGQGLRLGVVSNANGTLRVAFERIGLASFFDVILDSAEEGLEKPDPRLFELALQRLGVTSDRAIHVGDMYYVDVVGARSAGLAAVLVDEAGLRANVDCKLFDPSPSFQRCCVEGRPRNSEFILMWVTQPRSVSCETRSARRPHPLQCSVYGGVDVLRPAAATFGRGELARVPTGDPGSLPSARAKWHEPVSLRHRFVRLLRSRLWRAGSALSAVAPMLYQPPLAHAAHIEIALRTRSGREEDADRKSAQKYAAGEHR